MSLTIDESAKVWAALREVIDPELGLDIVAMGLVYGVREEGDVVVIDITLTTPGCPVSESIPADAVGAVGQALEGSHPVDVEIVWDPPWTPDRMSPEAAAALGLKRG